MLVHWRHGCSYLIDYQLGDPEWCCEWMSIVVDSKSELCTRFTYIIALSVTAFIAFYQVNHIRCFA